MKLRKSRILACLRDKRFPMTVKINLTDPRVTEIAGIVGVDGVWLCNEHVPGDWLMLEHQIRAARIHDIDTLVRVSRGSYSEYIKPLEAGATGIIVPHVETASEAQQIVDMVRFHPLGKRAIDGGNVDGLFCRAPMDKYLSHANNEILLVLQIESPLALRNLNEIARVIGYDALMFGSGDYAHLIGKPGQFDAPEVIAGRKMVAAAATHNGKYTMCAGMVADLGALIAEGHSIFNIGSDVWGLGEYFSQMLAAQIESFNQIDQQRRDSGEASSASHAGQPVEEGGGQASAGVVKQAGRHHGSRCADLGEGAVSR